MSILAELEQELAERPVSEKDVEDAAMRTVPEGWYHAALEGVEEIDSQKTGNKAVKLTFALLGGPKPGWKVDHAMWTKGKDQKATDNCTLQILRFARRLGIAEKVTDDKGKEIIKLLPGKDFKDALGRECIIEVYVEEEKDEKTGRTFIKNKVRMHGVHSLDDVKAREKAHLASDGVKAKAAAQREQDDLSDIPV